MPTEGASAWRSRSAPARPLPRPRTGAPARPRKTGGCLVRSSCHRRIMKLTAIIYPDSDSEWLVAECPEIGTASQGKTEDEALANLREATELYLESFPKAHPKTAAIRTFELAHA